MARDFAVRPAQSVEPYGILITAGDNDTFPLWYAQEVEGIRPDVTLANLSLMNTRWHLRQLRRRVTPEFDVGKSVALWGGDASASSTGGTAVQQWTRPTEPVFGLTDGQLDSLPECMQVPRRAGSVVDSLQIAFGCDVSHAAGPRDDVPDPGQPGQAADLLLLERRRLSRPDPGPGPLPRHPGPGAEADAVTGHDDQRFPGDNPVLGLMDYPRTEKLLWNVYHWKAIARPRPRGWVDPPSASILQLYAVLYRGLAETLRSKGDMAKAAEADSISQAIRINLQPIH